MRQTYTQRLAEAANRLLEAPTGCGCCGDYDEVRAAKEGLRAVLKDLPSAKKDVGHGADCSCRHCRMSRTFSPEAKEESTMSNVVYQPCCTASGPCKRPRAFAHEGGAR